MLMAAADFSTAEIVGLLLDKGADIHARDSRGFTPLLTALTTHYYKPDLVRVLVTRGADVNAVTEKGLTPLMCAFEPDLVRMLLVRGADIHAVDRSGRSVLYHHGRYLATTRLLVEKGGQGAQE